MKSRNSLIALIFAILFLFLACVFPIPSPWHKVQSANSAVKAESTIPAAAPKPSLAGLQGRTSLEFIEITEVVPSALNNTLPQFLYDECLRSPHGWGSPLTLQEARDFPAELKARAHGGRSIYFFVKGDALHGGTGTLHIGKFDLVGGEFKLVRSLLDGGEDMQTMAMGIWLDLR